MLRFYVYVDGSDLDECETVLMQAFEQFAAEAGMDANVINDKFPRTPDLPLDYLPGWNLGLNFTVPVLDVAVAERIVSFFARLAGSTDREFVVGAWLADRQISEDLVFIGADPPDDTASTLCLMANSFAGAGST